MQTAARGEGLPGRKSSRRGGHRASHAGAGAGAAVSAPAQAPSVLGDGACVCVCVEVLTPALHVMRASPHLTRALPFARVAVMPQAYDQPCLLLCSLLRRPLSPCAAAVRLRACCLHSTRALAHFCWRCWRAAASKRRCPNDRGVSTRSAAAGAAAASRSGGQPSARAVVSAGAAAVPAPQELRDVRRGRKRNRGTSRASSTSESRGVGSSESSGSPLSSDSDAPVAAAASRSGGQPSAGVVVVVAAAAAVAAPQELRDDRQVRERPSRRRVRPARYRVSDSVSDRRARSRRQRVVSAAGRRRGSTGADDDLASASPPTVSSRPVAADAALADSQRERQESARRIETRRSRQTVRRCLASDLQRSARGDPWTAAQVQFWDASGNASTLAVHGSGAVAEDRARRAVGVDEQHVHSSETPSVSTSSTSTRVRRRRCRRAARRLE
jgi:hypothetical protein